jgi:hypothetical protein
MCSSVWMGTARCRSDFVRASVEALFSNPEAWVAGGSVKTVATGLVGRTIAAATSLGSGWGTQSTSGLGGTTVGWTRWPLARTTDGCWIELVTLTSNWSETRMTSSTCASVLPVAESGCPKHQDHLLRTQHPGQALATVFSVRVLEDPYDPEAWSPGHISTDGSTGAGAFSRNAGGRGSLLVDLWWVLAVVAVAYGLVLAYGSIEVLRQEGPVAALLAPIVFISLHFGYGLGSLWGIVRFVVLRGWGLPRPEEHRLSR